MKKTAWTMAELTIAMIVIIVISAISLTVFKPNMQKAAIYMYAIIKNLEKANNAISEKYGEFYPNDAKSRDDNNAVADDWYCVNLADMLSLTQVANCKKSATNGDVNFRFANGITIQGVASSWKRPYPTSSYYIKNIVVDIDGEKGFNKIGIDRFPLRIYNGGAYDGTIKPINCANDIVYDDEYKIVTLSDSTGKSPFCKQKFDSSGASANNNFLTNNEVISYDIYRPDNAEEETTASIVVWSASPMEADCGAYGGNGFYIREHCNTFGQTINAKCAKEETCSSCTSTNPAYNVCPSKNTDGSAIAAGSRTEAGCKTLAATTNPNDVACFTLLHRPSQGLGAIAGGLLEEVDI